MCSFADYVSFYLQGGYSKLNIAENVIMLLITSKNLPFFGLARHNARGKISWLFS